MDFAKLSQNEKLAVYGSIAVIVAGLVGLGAAGLGLLAVLAAIGMLAVIFVPQVSPSTRLPGSKGSFMLILGAVAGVVLVLGLLTILGSLGLLLQFAAFQTVFYLIAVAGGVLMAWAGWQEFQAEGGKFQVGSPVAGGPSGSSATPPAAAPPPAAATPPAAAPPPAAPPSAAQPPPAAPPPPSEPPPSADGDMPADAQRRDPEDRPLP